ncbi:calcium-dependent secretion activator 1-like isoform X2 [Gordionus sp. m RMFG-2023]|uniref:calcium-dependent secretion activator 1-like isoform X2 n=1 Tax=Gordionus sp. m RMFG-2023 TaxID=3053472 RepID=UPI0031FE3F9E
MLVPSSSEEDSDNSSNAVEEGGEVATDVLQVPLNTYTASQSLHGLPIQSRSISPSHEINSHISLNQFNIPRKIGGSETVSISSSTMFRPISPSPSILSEKDRISIIMDESQDKSEEEHKRRLQIYVFVARCISYPFNARQPTDMTRRYYKVTKSGLQQIKERFSNFLNVDSNLAVDEAFYNAIQHYFDVFLKSDRVLKMVTTGGCSTNDFREIFKVHIDKKLKILPNKEGLNKDMALSAYMNKYDALFKGGTSFSLNEDGKKLSTQQSLSASSRSQHQSFMQFQTNRPSAETALNKEQLFDMFQQILTIKKFEHQLLYNALQLDNQDEQAATIRRELDSRLQMLEKCTKDRKLLPKFVLQKEMEILYFDEVRKQINQLMVNLESLPVSKTATDSKYSLQKFKGYHHHHRSTASLSKMDFMDGNENSLSKTDVVLSFNLEVIVMEVKGLVNLNPNRLIYCTMEVDGGVKLQTDMAEVSKPCWDSQGDFVTAHTLPIIKIKLYAKNVKMLKLEDKELGKVVIKPTPFSSKMPEWYKMLAPNVKTSSQSTKDNAASLPNSESSLKIKVTIRMDKPQNMKHGGYLYAKGSKNLWKKWRKRYFVLVQVSQYTFAMCSYREKKADPREMMQLDGFTIDFAQSIPGLVGGHYFFTAVKEGENIVFASEEENDRALWVQALCRATGQSHRPIPPSPLMNDKESDRIRKHGMDDLVQADPCKFDHNALFTLVQKLTLDHRLGEPIASLGWFSPGQIFVLEEYCSRYGVRGCMRHLGYLDNLITKAQAGVMIDPTLLHYSYAFCASHVHGNRPDGIGTVLYEEKEKFDLIKEKIRILLEHQITNFRYCFPFGRPEGALKSSLSLLERVLMKDIVTPAPPDDVRNIIRKCLEKAALVNYTKISSFSQTEVINSTTAPIKKKIDGLINLAEMCIELLQQNEEYHAEAFSWFKDLMIEHEEIFWSLFAVDLDSTLDFLNPDSWDAFPLFQLLNNYLTKSETLNNGKFHQHLQNVFAPMVVRYVDIMESSIAQSIHRGFEREKWETKGNGCTTSEDMFWKLESLQTFIEQLKWPDEVFAKHLEQRLKLMAADMIESCVARTYKSFDAMLSRGKKTTDYVLPLEICTMINVLLDAKNRSMKLCAVDGADMGFQLYLSRCSS